jgi:hypothetical protein
VVKLLHWEPPYTAWVRDARDRELAVVKSVNRMRSMNEAVGFAVPVLVACATFIAFVLPGGTLSAEIVFTTVSLFSLLQVRCVCVPCLVLVCLRVCLHLSLHLCLHLYLHLRLHLHLCVCVHSMTLCCAVLCCAVLCCAVLCCAVLCCAVLCCAVLCCAVRCCAVLRGAVLCCAVLC